VIVPRIAADREPGYTRRRLVGQGIALLKSGATIRTLDAAGAATLAPAHQKAEQQHGQNSREQHDEASFSHGLFSLGGFSWEPGVGVKVYTSTLAHRRKNPRDQKRLSSPKLGIECK
jgi:hypothetical protein